MRDTIVNVLKIGVSLALLLLLVWKIGWRETWETLRQADARYLLAAWSLYLFSMLLRAYRWQVLLRIQKLEAPLSRLTSLYFIGTFFNTVLPTGFGGDVVRMYELSKDSRHGAESVSTVLVDRLCGFVVLFIMASLALPFSYRIIPPLAGVVIVAITVLTLLGVCLAANDGVWAWLARLPLLGSLLGTPRVQQFRVSIAAYRTRSITKALLASLAFNILLMILNYLVALALGVRISPWYFLVFIPIISFLLTLPVSFSGLGVREGGYVLLFGQAGVPHSLALGMSLCIYFMTVATGLFGGLLYALQGYRDLDRTTG
ncbi:MAG TPA: lysylphosphatidylglycerol synthase transmembrane domain-containing protein [Anaerolineae bacterium]|nr:lysylphosphatidylglycerol synthase transmembrane domain-containing protein [Anaerolineae bacterium]